ncbi:hypothetical protein CSB11_00600 [Candidatus Campbellbacteria bacterium]|nr:MAG: hypothetical protein CSB11_00600 [Candidatus Campbellbacteria bacterium]
MEDNKTNNTKTIVSIIVLILIVAGAIFAYNHYKKDQPVTEEPKNPVVDPMPEPVDNPPMPEMEVKDPTMPEMELVEPAPMPEMEVKNPMPKPEVQEEGNVMGDLKKPDLKVEPVVQKSPAPVPPKPEV